MIYLNYSRFNPQYPTLREVISGKDHKSSPDSWSSSPRIRRIHWYVTVVKDPLGTICEVNCFWCEIKWIPYRTITILARGSWITTPKTRYAENSFFSCSHPIKRLAAINKTRREKNLDEKRDYHPNVWDMFSAQNKYYFKIFILRAGVIDNDFPLLIWSTRNIDDSALSM